MTHDELKNKIKNLCDKQWSVWAEMHGLVNDFGLDDYIFTLHPIKFPSTQIIDNARLIEKYLHTLIKETP